MMLDQIKSTDLFADYYAQWVHVYKEDAIRKVTLDKYLMTQMWVEKLIPELRMCDMTRIAYQQLLNDYAENHERQTTMDFHHQLKGAILDAVDEGLIDKIYGRPTTQEERQAWLDEECKNCFDDYTWFQEYCCIAIDEACAFLPYELIATCEMQDVLKSLETIMDYNLFEEL